MLKQPLIENITIMHVANKIIQQINVLIDKKKLTRVKILEELNERIEMVSMDYNDNEDHIYSINSIEE